MTSSLAHQLLSDERASTLRRSDRAVLEAVARLAGPDGRPRYPVRHKTLAEKAGYSLPAVRKSLRRLSGRDETCPHLRLISVESGTGHESTRYTVTLSWDAAPPEFRPRDAAPEAVPERPKPAEERPRPPRPRPAEIAPHGGPWLPDEPTPEPPAEPEDQGDVVELLAPPDENDRDTWCEDARRIGRPHRGRRCCGMTARQLRDKEERDRKARAVAREKEEFATRYGPAAAAARQEQRTPEVIGDLVAQTRAMIRNAKGRTA